MRHCIFLSALLILVLSLLKGNTGTTDGTTTEPPPTPGSFCQGDPCGNGTAKCVALASNYTCQCQYGFYYENKDCHKGVVFPGVITLQGYNENVQNVNSKEYEEMATTIKDFFKVAFASFEAYQETVIRKVQFREVRTSSVSVTVTNLFTENSDLNNETIQEAVDNAVKNSTVVLDYRAESYCASYNCDTQTTDCIEKMFPDCVCKDNFSKSEWDDRSCSECKSCSASENKYCVRENEIPTCKCFSNFKMTEDDSCVACSVGYSGENCENKSELILIIVGTVLGAAVLSLLIAISVVSVRAKHKKDPEKKSLIEPGYSDPGDRPAMMFPRVQTTSGHSNPEYQPHNPYESRSTNRGRFLDRDYDDLYETSQEPGGFRMHSRY
ncbi:mucin-13 isoform X2 [Melanerpes formicivorus]|uniref:mucin-13 isoform X2 n=1 Tax=Melanerpes formicivorus TaxID=211600 RepID=UPI00358E2452